MEYSLHHLQIHLKSFCDFIVVRLRSYELRKHLLNVVSPQRVTVSRNEIISFRIIRSAGGTQGELITLPPLTLTLILLGSQRTRWGTMSTFEFIHHTCQQENSDLVKHKQNRNPNSQNSCYVDIKRPVR